MRIFSLILLLNLIFSCKGLTSFEYHNYSDWYGKKTEEYQGWKYIVIHHSATSAGSVKGFDNFHRKQGYGGVAYHFVIGNGKGMKDGEVKETFRWKDQISGTHVTVDSWEYNVFGIGICLVGNLQEGKMTKKQAKALKDLVQKLQKEYKINAKNVISHNEVPYDNDPEKKQKTLCPGKFINKEEFVTMNL